jgi:hypothetical protein
MNAHLHWADADLHLLRRLVFTDVTGSTAMGVLPS